MNPNPNLKYINKWISFPNLKDKNNWISILEIFVWSQRGSIIWNWIREAKKERRKYRLKKQRVQQQWALDDKPPEASARRICTLCRVMSWERDQRKIEMICSVLYLCHQQCNNIILIQYPFVFDASYLCKIFSRHLFDYILWAIFCKLLIKHFFREGVNKAKVHLCGQVWLYGQDETENLVKRSREFCLLNIWQQIQRNDTVTSQLVRSSPKN